ncbi:IPT/TIG domain-containing protein [Microscilla marina]|nr:IPT/TIG domain-containing protein [Microscilla marina]
MKKRYILLLWAIVCCTGILHAQKVMNYKFRAYQGTFTPLVNATSLLDFSTGSAYGNNYSIGFPFKYASKTYDKFAISTDGFITLGQGSTHLTSSSWDNNLRNGLKGKRPIIAPLWDDLSLYNGLVSYKTEGIVGNRTLTVEWLKAYWYNRIITISVQVKLYEASGKIEFIYRREGSYLHSNYRGASIGITGENTGIQSFLSLQDVSTSPTVSSTNENGGLNSRPATGQVYAFAPPPPLAITSFSPVRGRVGTNVTIKGSGFSTTATNNEVKFNGIKATITSATPTELKARVPVGATTGKVSVTVKSETVTSNNNFTVVVPPSITSFTPAQGAIRSLVIIKGANFNPVAANNTVKFNGKTATVNAASATELQVSVPVGATTGKITVTANGETITSATNFTVVLSANAPRITSFTPTSGPEGTNVTINGANFSATAANNTVKFNGKTATVTAATTTALQVKVPTGATTGKITVEVNDETAVSTNNFILPPTITSFTPARGLVGTNMIIRGKNFSTTAANNTVKFNGKAATVISSTTTALQVKVPTGATTGKVSVEVNGKTATSATDFTVIFPPTITSFTPDKGAIRSKVTIKGAHFSPTAANNTVKLNGKTAIVTAATPTELQVTVPVGATTGKITLTVNGITIRSATNFSVILSANAPQISGFTPSQGSVGTKVTIRGRNFSTITAKNTVTFNGRVATVTAATATTLEVTVPSRASTGKITVEVNDETALSTGDFTVTYPAPTITRFTPDKGKKGAYVTIEGTNFSSTRQDNTVKFNGIEATIDYATGTRIRATVPRGATTGKITVEVYGQTATSATDFTVISTDPTITSFTPERGGKGTTVTITGTNFSSTRLYNTVKFNGRSATIISATPTEIKTSVPSRATTGKITVRVNFKTATSATDFIVNSSSPTAPTITSFTPSQGGEGTNVTITGTNFSSNPLGNLVEFNGMPAIVTSATPTEIKTSVPLLATTGKITVTVNFETATSATDFTVGDVTGLPQNLKEAQLLLFPNPFVANMTMEVKGKVSSNQVKVVVFNNKGKAVLAAKRTLENGRLVLPMKELSSGNYLVKIYIGKETVLRRIVKL